MPDVQAWSIPGSAGEPILGNVHRPAVEARGVVLLAHGFKGYRDYGFFPYLAQRLADAGFIVHRFNFSHSGMTNEIDTFARPDLFQRDTPNRQVADLYGVIEAVQRGQLAGQGLPYVLFGHSRGGVAVLLAAGRAADDEAFAQPAGVVTAAAPARANPYSAQEVRRMLDEGSIESPSSRTGQVLRVGRAFVQEQLDDERGHDLSVQVRRIRCPMLFIHGDADPTVPPDDAAMLRSYVDAQTPAALVLLRDGDHVFNTPNPMPDPSSHPPSRQLQQMCTEVTDFAGRCCR